MTSRSTFATDGCAFTSASSTSATGCCDGEPNGSLRPGRRYRYPRYGSFPSYNRREPPFYTRSSRSSPPPDWWCSPSWWLTSRFRLLSGVIPAPALAWAMRCVPSSFRTITSVSCSCTPRERAACEWLQGRTTLSRDRPARRPPWRAASTLGESWWLRSLSRGSARRSTTQRLGGPPRCPAQLPRRLLGGRRCGARGRRRVAAGGSLRALPHLAGQCPCGGAGDTGQGANRSGLRRAHFLGNRYVRPTAPNVHRPACCR